MQLKARSFHGTKIYCEFDPWAGNQYEMIAYVRGKCYVARSSRKHRARKLLVKRLVTILGL